MTNITPFYISWSQISTYSICSAKWLFSRIFKQEHIPSSLKFGSTYHKVIAEFLLHYSGTHAKMHLDELMNKFKKFWKEPLDDSDIPILYGSKENEEYLLQLAENMLGTYLKDVEPGEVVAIECPFEFQVDNDLIVSGYIDLVEYKNGSFYVIDHKTCKTIPKLETLCTDQLGIYKIGVYAKGILLVK